MTYADTLANTLDLSADTAARWMRCPGSAALNRQHETPGQTTPPLVTAESLAAHRLAAWCLETGLDAGDWPHGDIRVSAHVFAPADLAKHVMAYVHLCHPLMLNAAAYAIDKRVDHGALTGQHGSYATADFVSVGASELVVVDFVYDDDTAIRAEVNERLQFHALGALETYGLVHDIATVRLIVCQPRLRHRDEWTTTPGALKQFAEIARARARQALQPDAASAFLNPGEAQCRYCPGKATCPALVSDVLATVAGDFDLATLLPKLDMIEDWCDAVRDRARRTIQDGGTIAGFKLVPGRRSVRAWSSLSEAESVMRSMRLRQEEMYDLSLIGPPAAERLLKDSPKRWARLTPLIMQREGLPVLVRDDTPPVVSEPPVSEPAETAWI